MVTLDVEMPGMDGLETLRAIRRFNATRAPGTEVGVIMVSAHTKRGAEVTIRALQDGAFDFVTKPTGQRPEENLLHLRQQLTGKIRLFLAGRRRQLRGHGYDAEPATRATGRTPRRRPVPTRRRQWARLRSVRAMVIASSTGGPKALETLLPDLRAHSELPIADRAAHAAEVHAVVGREPRPAVLRNRGRSRKTANPSAPQTTYLAPGGKHLLLRQDQGRLVTALNEQPPENGCRPSADVLFRSAAAALQGNVVARGADRHGPRRHRRRSGPSSGPAAT